MKSDFTLIIAPFLMLALIAFAATVIQESRSHWRINVEIEEIQVTALKRAEPGSLRWRINKCRPHIEFEDGRMRFGHMDEYLDCRDAALMMFRKDI